MKIVRNTCYAWLHANRPLQDAMEFDENLIPQRESEGIRAVRHLSDDQLERTKGVYGVFVILGRGGKTNRDARLMSLELSTKL